MRRHNSDTALLLIMILKTIAIIGLSGVEQRNQTISDLYNTHQAVSTQPNSIQRGTDLPRHYVNITQV